MTVPGSLLQCPHCRIGIVTVQAKSRFESEEAKGDFLFDKLYIWGIDHAFLKFEASNCPLCRKTIVTGSHNHGGIRRDFQIWPRGVSRPVAAEVPPSIAVDFTEAVEVLPVSAKASAALSRRCLQAVLREAGKTTKKDLADQIDEVLSRLPSTVAENLDHIRVVGNFAAHEIKSKQTGLIVDVEPHEAEFNLDVLEDLFDCYYVQPAKAAAKRAALEVKLKEAGKPPLKKP